MDSVKTNNFLDWEKTQSHPLTGNQNGWGPMWCTGNMVNYEENELFLYYF